MRVFNFRFKPIVKIYNIRTTEIIDVEHSFNTEGRKKKEKITISQYSLWNITYARINRIISYLIFDTRIKRSLRTFVIGRYTRVSTFFYLFVSRTNIARSCTITLFVFDPEYLFMSMDLLLSRSFLRCVQGITYNLDTLVGYRLSEEATYLFIWSRVSHYLPGTRQSIFIGLSLLMRHLLVEEAVNTYGCLCTCTSRILNSNYACSYKWCGSSDISWSTPVWLNLGHISDIFPHTTISEQIIHHRRDQWHGVSAFIILGNERYWYFLPRFDG